MRRRSTAQLSRNADTKLLPLFPKPLKKLPLLPDPVVAGFAAVAGAGAGAAALDADIVLY